MRYTVVIHFWDGSKLSQQYAFNQLCPIMGKDLDDSAFRTTLTNLKAKDGLVASNGRLCTMTGLYVGQKENGRIELSYNEDNALKVEGGVIHNIEINKPRKERRKLSADELELKKEYQKLVQTDLFARCMDAEERKTYQNKRTWRN